MPNFLAIFLGGLHLFNSHLWYSKSDKKKKKEENAGARLWNVWHHYTLEVCLPTSSTPPSLSPHCRSVSWRIRRQIETRLRRQKCERKTDGCTSRHGEEGQGEERGTVSCASVNEEKLRKSNTLKWGRQKICVPGWTPAALWPRLPWRLNDHWWKPVDLIEVREQGRRQVSWRVEG